MGAILINFLLFGALTLIGLIFVNRTNDYGIKEFFVASLLSVFCIFLSFIITKIYRLIFNCNVEVINENIELYIQSISSIIIFQLICIAGIILSSV